MRRVPIPVHSHVPFPEAVCPVSRATGRRSTRRAARVVWGLVLMGAAAAPSAARAQGLAGPTLQRPTVSEREYAAALVGGGGTALLLQWREGWTGARAGGAIRTQLLLEGGLADMPGGSAPRPLMGVGVAQTLVRASADQPLDAVWTAGAGMTWVEGGLLVRVPVGVSVGHAFALRDGAVVTPFAHPRLQGESLSCGARACGESRGALSLAFDLGVDAQVTPAFGLRAAVLFSGGGVLRGGDRVAIGAHWTPPGLAR
jgi:hypothetical protein